MIQTNVTILNKTGIHARPASLLAAAINKYDCRVRLEKDETSCEPKGLIELMKLQCHMGDKLKIICDGPEESACLTEIVSLIDSQFGEK